MKLRPILSYLGLAWSLAAFAQAPTIEWQKCLGGSDGDFGQRIRPTADGGYVLLGSSTSTDGQVQGAHGNEDVWLVKLNASGDIQWQRALGGSDGDESNDLTVCSDGGYLILGSTVSTDGDVMTNDTVGLIQAWVVKLDTSGTIEWEQCYGVMGGAIPYAILETSGGGYALTANVGTVDQADDTWLAKLDSAGTILWERTYGGSSSDIITAMQQTVDGGYILAGVTASNDGDVWGLHNSEDGWVVKVDASGNIEWQRALGGSFIDTFMGVHQAIDGGYLAVGYTHSTDGDVTGWHEGYDPWEGYPYPDGWVVKLSAAGVIEWQRALGGTDFDSFWGSAYSTDGLLTLVGEAYSDDGNVSIQHGAGDLWVAQLNAFGTLQWQRSLGGTELDHGNGAAFCGDGSTVLTGFTSSVDGDASGNHGGADAWVVKLAGNSAGIAAHSTVGFAINPVPAADELYITAAAPLRNERLTLTDALGREVLRASMTGTSHTLAVGDLPRGVYVVTLRTGTAISTQRVVLE